MPEEIKAGCARPTGGPVGETPGTVPPAEGGSAKEEKVMVKVGGKAPDFASPAYIQGKFAQIKLSDYLGKWVVLCFYPGDFTFV